MSTPNKQSVRANPTYIAEDILQGRRIEIEEQIAGVYREINRAVALPAELAIESEGSWINSKHNRNK